MKTINKLEQLKKEMDQAEVTNYEVDRASYIAYKAWQDAIKAYETELNTINCTDLEPEEQDCVDYMLEFFNYEQNSFELEELREILAENRDEENTVMACDTLINALLKRNKEIIETKQTPLLT